MAKKRRKTHKKKTCPLGGCPIINKIKQMKKGHSAFLVGLLAVVLLSVLSTAIMFGSTDPAYLSMSKALLAIIFLIGIVVGIYNIDHKELTTYLIAVLLLMILQSFYLVSILKMNLYEIFSQLSVYRLQLDIPYIIAWGFIFFYFLVIAVTVAVKKILVTVFVQHEKQPTLSHDLFVISFLVPIVLFLINVKAKIMVKYYAIFSICLIIAGLYIGYTALKKIDFDYLVSVLFISYFLLRLIVSINNQFPDLVPLSIDLAIQLWLTLFAATTFLPVLKILYTEARD